VYTISQDDPTTRLYQRKRSIVPKRPCFIVAFSAQGSGSSGITLPQYIQSAERSTLENMSDQHAERDSIPGSALGCIVGVVATTGTEPLPPSLPQKQSADTSHDTVASFPYSDKQATDIRAAGTKEAVSTRTCKWTKVQISAGKGISESSITMRCNSPSLCRA
jgi:hypothetical protein